MINLKGAIFSQDLPKLNRLAEKKWIFVSLLFSLFYFFPIYFYWEDPSFFEVLPYVLIAYAVFTGFYLFSLSQPLSQQVLIVLAFQFLVAGIAFFYHGGNSLYCYVAFLAGYYFKNSVAIAFFVLNILLQLGVAISVERFNVSFLGPSLLCTIPIFFQGRFAQQSEWMKVLERKKNQQIEHLTTIAERERIARDMHDLLGHSLSSLALKAELAGKMMDKSQFELAKNEIDQVAALAREALSNVRQAVTNLKQKGIQEQLMVLIAQLEQFGFQVTHDLEFPEMDAKTESTLILIGKEWTTNILRHSSGREVSFNLSVDDQAVVMAIADNGDCDEIIAGNGIEGMKERMQEIRGHLSIESCRGVRMRATAPLLSSNDVVVTDAELVGVQL